jgi:hypothetical protein
VRVLEREDRRAVLVGGVPRVLGRGVREQRVSGRQQRQEELVVVQTLRVPRRGGAGRERLRREPIDDDSIEVRGVLFIVGILGVVGLGRCHVARAPHEPGERVADRRVARGLGVHGAVTGHLVGDLVVDRDGQRVRPQWVRDRRAVRERVRLVGEHARQALRARSRIALVPEGLHHGLAALDALQRLLQSVQVGAVPGGEEHGAVLAVAAPPCLPVGGARAPEGLAVAAADREERVRVVRLTVLNPLPRRHQGVECFGLAVLSLVHQVVDGPAGADGVRLAH